LSPEEYEKVLVILGREPSFEELGVFSVMWSEHCSYKNSRPELRKFPTTGPSVLVKAGEENAGVIDIGDGCAVAFKIESHNHPSAVEPFQGAATGVGGIIRDIFTMGARPVFLMDSLRFGSIKGDSEQAKTNRRLFAGVVAGIAHYGNCIGLPTIAGEVYFDDSYNGNPLVNAFCLGILRHEQIARGAAEGIGNPVFYVGAETGRDGLAGAAFASRELTEESKADRPAVQVGDPFREKLLLEACLELLATDCVAGIQDMGAAGLTCSTCETASRGGTGVEIDIQLVPQRAKGQTPYEVLLSESQERMLVIVKKGQEATVKEIFEKWDLPYAEIGVVTDDGQMRVRNGKDVVVDVPARALADDGPLYSREAAPFTPPAPLDLATVTQADPLKALPQLLSHPSIASKRWVWRQYDHMVRTGTAVLPGSDAAVFIVREANKILAAATDCNAIYCKLDPSVGSRIAVAECARNLACSGAVPIGVTDNLNFGNPHKPENFYQLRAAVEGISEGCRAFGVPVTGGNVSLYNESPAGAIDPTPTISMVGRIDDIAHITTQSFKEAGDQIILIGETGDELGGSHYLLAIHGRKEGAPPALVFEKEIAIHHALLSLIRKGLVRSAHDCSEGGLAVTLAESCFGTKFGATVDLGDTDQRPDVLLFNETQGRIVISVKASDVAVVEAELAASGVPFRKIGEVTAKTDLSIKTGTNAYTWPVASLNETFEGAIPSLMLRSLGDFASLSPARLALTGYALTFPSKANT
ncbi:MAG: phosphoribosylformylglycinamidine synthase subunit PurL, partial [Verrucomicrobia bacterium]|nr:phosphoribosylformylglycinamidine synthase subunit PurL [Verrucomicrobiota bacterium]